MKGDVHIDQGGGIGLDSRLVVDGISSTDPFCLAIMRTI
jgi:hypothetical protein